MVEDLVDDRSARRAYLVLHDYGMGGLWWWIRASSAEEITAAFAEVEVFGGPEAVAGRTWDLDVLDIEDATRGKLASFYQTRQRQRQDPALGRLFGKDRVYLRLPDEEGQATE